MKRALGLLLIAALVGYGLVRIGVGAALLAQTWSIVDVAEFADAVTEVAQFLAARDDRALISFSVPAYFAWIMAMGALLVGGGSGALRRRRWGYALLAIYLAMHAALFVNYREVNPKLIGLAVSIVLAIGLAWLRPPERPDAA